MDRKMKWGMIERLWRSLRYEYIYLHAFEGGAETWAGVINNEHVESHTLPKLVQVILNRPQFTRRLAV